MIFSLEYFILVNVLLLMVLISHFIETIKINKLLVIAVKVGVTTTAGIGFLLASNDFTLIGLYTSFLLITVFLNSIENQKNCAEKFNEEYIIDLKYIYLIIISLILSLILISFAVPNLPIQVTQSYPIYLLVITAVIQFLNYLYILLIHKEAFYIDQHNVLSNKNERNKFIGSIIISIVFLFFVIFNNSLLMYYIFMTGIFLIFGYYKILFSDNLDKDHWVIITPYLTSILLSIFVLFESVVDIIVQLF
jgi:hypothetical protein